MYLLNPRYIGVIIAAVLFWFVSNAFGAEPRTAIVSKAAQSAAAASGVTSAATSTISITVPGAKLGDACVASHSVDVTGLILSCAITATDTAKITVTNHTTNGTALSSGTTRAFLIPKGTR